MPLPLGPGATVAVVGGGPCGLLNVKRLKEAGFNVVGFEREAELGGLWIYREGPTNKMYTSLRTNASFASMCFDDFPLPKAWSAIPSHWQVAEYYQAAAAHFGIDARYRMSTSVERWEEAEDGRWRLQIRPAGKSELEEMLVEGVVVCTGQTALPRDTSDYPGVDQFLGDSFHSSAYRSNAAYHGKKVMVVGGKASGLDIAQDLSWGAKQVVLSLRQPMREPAAARYVGGRVFNEHYREVFWLYVPEWLQGLYFRVLARVSKNHLGYWYDHQREASHRNEANRNILAPSYKLPPRGSVVDLMKDGKFLPSKLQPILPFLGGGGFVGDIFQRIAMGAVRVRPEIKEFKGSTVVFKDGGVEEDVEAVVWATGYDRGIGENSAGLGGEGLKFGFGSESNRRAEHAQKGRPPKLYQNVFPPRRPGLAYGLVTHPQGPHFPVMDIISKWIAQVFKGGRKLPPPEVMEEAAMQDIEFQGGNPLSPFSLPAERNMEAIAMAMGYDRPSTGEIAKGLLFGGAARRAHLMRWLRSPRHRPWIRPEDMTDQLEPTTDSLYHSRL